VVAAHYKQDDLLNCWTSRSDICGYHVDFHEGHGTVAAGKGRGMGIACYVWIGLYSAIPEIPRTVWDQIIHYRVDNKEVACLCPEPDKLSLDPPIPTVILFTSRSLGGSVAVLWEQIQLATQFRLSINRWLSVAVGVLPPGSTRPRHKADRLPSSVEVKNGGVLLLHVPMRLWCGQR